jgi:tRNA (guanosine-2'-O-)-methyltransferase
MTPERFARLKQVLLRRQHDLTVLADEVHKEHNVSAILRTCDAVGIARLHAVATDSTFRRHHMVAGGSKRWVELRLHADAAEAYSEFRSARMQVLTAHAADDAIDFREVDFTRPTALVLGAELTGPSAFAIENADYAVKIPMHGLVESLNVSVAAAVILFEAERQRSAAGLYSRPPPDSAKFDQTLFEWAHPDIARRCRELGREYPPLTDDGDLASNPFENL